MTIPKTDEVELICKGCKSAVNQSIGGRKHHLISCVAYGCETWFRNPCTAYSIFNYAWDRLVEEGMIKEPSNDSNSTST